MKLAGILVIALLFSTNIMVNSQVFYEGMNFVHSIRFVISLSRYKALFFCLTTTICS